EESERMPLTVAAYDRDGGTITLIFQIVGAGTMELNTLQQGDALQDCVGPLGEPTHTEGLRKVCIVGGGVGCAIALPVADKLHKQGAVVHSVIGFRSKDLVILEDAFRSVSDETRVMTDNGSYGEKGLVTAALESLIQEGNRYDKVFAIGPLVMMKFVSLLTKKYEIPTVVSMNPVMVDGTGMCGGCRITVGGETKFACVDGPDFDGHLVDFDEAISRSSMYTEFEGRRREDACRLFVKEPQ
ncbi:MAG: sulfide/dihydroorotate dehydrogenase-like FAD/NAD-binding protein, partial [Clostridiales bacterium]|nr:sulfide/dihydroorotate dehydrogenase-like FAD/NAD-binding protein [Clostridiales bacterium]